MARVELIGVEKRYGDVRVLERVDLDVADGEYIVILGRSGCGKSTLLRSIAGLEEITAGEVRIGGRRVDGVSPRDRDVAMVFQGYALYPHMTVRENMAFALKVRGRPAAEITAAVDEAAAQLELAPLLDRLPAQLSGGQRQRVAMGRAIVRRPAVFLFDEPLSNLDAALRGHVRLELKRMHRRLNATILHVTHDQTEAMTLADRILLLDKGVVQQLGTPRDVYERPANTFVATFIGAPAMNLVPAHGSGEAAWIDGMAESVPSTVKGAFTLGIRPGDLRLGAEGPIPAKVDVVEALGDEAYVHLVCGKADKVRLVARVHDTRLPASGDDVRLAFGAIHAFDRSSGARL
jgi:ABC-type sugar transport system ATPase subunit